MSIQWEDITSYSRGDTERIPRWWKASVTGIRLSVGNSHIYYKDNKTWLLTCAPWFDAKALKATNEHDAKAEGLMLVRGILEHTLEQMK